MTTKVPAELSSTPSIVDNGNATAMTIDTNENLGLASRISVGTTTVGGGNTRAVITGGMDNYLQMVSTTGNGGISIGNHAGGIMLFYSHTGALGSESYTQNLRLDTDGLKFGTDSAAANALDDYEEGTWTVSDGSGAGLSLTFEKNRYTKIGRLVVAHTRVTYPTTSNSSTATIALPFPASTNATGSVTGGIVSEQDYSSGVAVVAAVDGTAGNRFRSNGVAALTNAQLSGKTLRYTVTYITA